MQNSVLPSTFLFILIHTIPYPHRSSYPCQPHPNCLLQAAAVALLKKPAKKKEKDGSKKVKKEDKNVSKKK